MKQIVINVPFGLYCDLESFYKYMHFDNPDLDLNSYYINMLKRGYNNCDGIMSKDNNPIFSLYKDSHEVK